MPYETFAFGLFLFFLSLCAKLTISWTFKLQTRAVSLFFSNSLPASTHESQFL